jgi:hypothetical protein
MRLKVLVLLSLPFMAQVFAACCECLDTVLKNYSNKIMTVANLDNSGIQPVVTNSSSVPKNAYGIKVEIQREIVACAQKQIPTFFSSAYALSCECPPTLAIAAKDSIVSFKVFSVYDFDDDHPANSDISEFFRVTDYDAYATIPQYLSTQSSFRYSRFGYSKWTLTAEDQLNFEITLLLLTAPKINSANKFRVDITLSDGRIFEQETIEIDFI